MRIGSLGLVFSAVLLACASNGGDADGATDTEGPTEDTDAGSSGNSMSSTTGDPASGSESSASSSTSEGGSTSEGSTTGPASCEESGAVFGRTYIDENGSDLSRYLGGFEQGVDTPLGEVELRLFGAPLDPEPSCEDGRYGVPTLDDGVYVVSAVDLDGHCSRRNCPRRLPTALEEGAVKILTIGDSVPVVGDPVTFPERVADIMSGLTEVEQINDAVSGTESSDWVPGGTYFEGIRDELASTDVVVISLGGNDILNFVSSADLGDLAGTVAGAQATVDQVVVNVRAIATEIRTENADVDVVFCLYPDYSQATQTPPWADFAFLPDGVITGLLARARDQITAEDDLVVVDLLELTNELPLPLDDYLADPLHFNDAGHDIYAREVFRALGGVIVGESPLNGESALENRHDFGVTP